jgi:polysaccharide deacetylase family protein (PEP-CTERM system associated)
MKEKIRVLTFDIEEWFHILDNESTKTEKQWSNFESRIHQNMDRIFDLLDRKNQSATFFCLGWIVKKYPEIIKAIDSRGYEIASHSSMHQLVYEQTPAAFEKDLEESLKTLEDMIGKKTSTYRAPGFSIKDDNKWAFEILIKHGITIDSSIFPAKRGHGGFESFGEAAPCFIDINGTRIKEFPINLWNILSLNIIFSGGGYFRLLPYPIIKKLTERSNYTMTYFHPRDFDPTQPMITELPVIRKFKSYYGLNGALEKLEQLLTDFKFVDIRTADKMIDWQKAKVIIL